MPSELKESLQIFQFVSNLPLDRLTLTKNEPKSSIITCFGIT